MGSWITGDSVQRVDQGHVEQSRAGLQTAGIFAERGRAYDPLFSWLTVVVRLALQSDELVSNCFLPRQACGCRIAATVEQQQLSHRNRVLQRTDELLDLDHPCRGVERVRPVILK